MAVKYYQSIVEYWSVENAGIFTVNEDKNKPEDSSHSRTFHVTR